MPAIAISDIETWGGLLPRGSGATFNPTLGIGDEGAEPMGRTLSVLFAPSALTSHLPHFRGGGIHNP